VQGVSRTLDKLRAYARVLPKARRNRTDLAGYLVRRPALLLATSAYETALMMSSRLPNDLKALASLKASTLIGCPF